ncbi:MAG: hypothetical protein ABG776_03455 [Cyanobacteria bacterium J06555_13]
MDDTLRSAQAANQVPAFGDARIRYESVGDEQQILYIDDLPVYALASGQGEPLSDQSLYQAYLQSLVQITEQTKLMRQELSEMNDYPDAIRRAEHQLEMLLKPGGTGGTFGIQDELETCWATLKEDATVTDPEAKMAELGEWFSEKIRAAISWEIAANPIETAE